VEDREARAANSLHALYRDHLCNPTFKYSINDAFGNPPIGGNDADPTQFIRDASTAKLPRWDMQVPNGMLGASGIRRPHHEGCGLGIESGGCDTTLAPSYYDTSLWSWAYITSSQRACAFRTNTRTPAHRLPLDSRLAACARAATPTWRRAGTGCSTSRPSP
jgi:hypothetical protein